MPGLGGSSPPPLTYKPAPPRTNTRAHTHGVQRIAYHTDTQACTCARALPPPPAHPKEPSKSSATHALSTTPSLRRVAAVSSLIFSMPMLYWSGAIIIQRGLHIGNWQVPCGIKYKKPESTSQIHTEQQAIAALSLQVAATEHKLAKPAVCRRCCCRRRHSASHGFPNSCTHRPNNAHAALATLFDALLISQ